MDSPPSSRPFPAASGSPGSSAVLGVGFGLALAAWLLSARTPGMPPALRLEPEHLPPPHASTVAPLPRLLSETGLRESGALAYSPQYPLWSDGASKRRFVSVPPGDGIDASDPDDWKFPPGTRFWKEFSFGEKVETRYLEKLPDGSFRFASYVWDAALGDAVLAPEQGQLGVRELSRGVAYDVPSRADCRACHEGRQGSVLGFNALQLSPERTSPLPPETVDLRELVARGVLRHFPNELLTNPPRIAAPSPLAREARGYLFGNCSGCHNGRGPLADVGLDFDQSVWNRDDAAPPSTLASSRFRLPGQQHSRRIQPGSPRDSVVWFRMSTRDGNTQMPPLGTKLVDHAGTDLIARYISSLSPNTPTPGK